MVMKPLGDVAETVVARIQTDWSHERPGGNFCPSCGHGLGDDKACAWCGWPDPEAMRKRTGETVAKATPAIEKAKELAPAACRIGDPDNLRAVLQKTRDWLEGFNQVGILDQEARALLAEIDAALN